MAKGFKGSMDSLPFILKLILVIFLDPLIYGIYRILGGHPIAGIIWLLTGGLFGIGWIIDIVTVILHGKPTVLA